MTILVKKVFISSKPTFVYLLCPPLCGPFSIQESAAGGLSYKARKKEASRGDSPLPASFSFSVSCHPGVSQQGRFSPAFSLHQRCDQPHRLSAELMQCRKRLYALFCHPHAFRQRLIKIFFDLLHHRILININAALKIQILMFISHIWTHVFDLMCLISLIYL